MKKYFIKSIAFGCFTIWFNLQSYSQNLDKKCPCETTCKLYGTSFLVKNIEKVDPCILQKIDISQYLLMKTPSENVEVVDNTTGLILIIFSDEELKVAREPIYKHDDFILNEQKKKNQ